MPTRAFAINFAAGSGGGGNAFTIIQPDVGTAPTAGSPTSTLTVTSGDGSVTVTGNSTTNTLDLRAASGGGPFNPGLTSQVITQFEDFDAFIFTNSSNTYTFGPLHLIFAGTGTTTKDAPTLAENGSHLGIVAQTVTATQSIGYYGGIANAFTPGAATITYGAGFQCATNLASGSTNSWVSLWGLGDSFPTLTNGVYFSWNFLSPCFLANCLKAGTPTQINTGITFSLATWYNFKIVLGPTMASFYVNGVLGCTIGTNIPQTAIGVVAAFTNQTGAGTVIRHDWAMQQYSLNRGAF